MKKLLLFAMSVLWFGMDAQTIESVSPNAGNLGQTLQVTITGNNTQFYSVSGTNAVTFFNAATEQLVVNSFQQVSNTVLVANVTIPNSVSSGPYNLNLYNTWGGGDYFLANAFTVTTNYNTISGNIGFDVDGNGCDASDLHMAGIKVQLNDGTNTSFTFTDADGNYFFNVPAGDFTVTPLPETPYFSLSPPSATVNFATEGGFAETRDFCLSPNGTHNDLSVTVLPLTAAQPGFDATYRLVYENNGNQTVSGSLNFAYNDALIDFVSATVAPTSQSADNLNWSYTGLLPFESRVIDITFNVNAPTDTPPVNIDDVLIYVATVEPSLGDELLSDNTDYFVHHVVGSLDPNDKAVTEGSQINSSEIGNFLHYLIRFQNTGTFAATNVAIEDMLSANLDTSTLEIVSASHPYRSTLTEGNKLEFFFDDINLPPESEDEPGSHGFIAFKIKPVASIGIGAVIENTAGIYFDFNFPVVTNTVSTTVTMLGTESADFDNTVQMYPNPVKGIGYIRAPEVISKIRVTDITGKLLLETRPNATDCAIDVSGFPNGVYLVTAETGRRLQNLKIVKE
jgi:uncharacterized repeat protein (TIGR01451 family)